MIKKEKFSQIPNGSSYLIDFLVTDLTSKVDSRGHDFVDVAASDGEQNVILKLWNKNVEQSGLKGGDVVRATVESKEYRGSTTYAIRSYEVSSELSAQDFLITPPISIAEMFSWIKQRIIAFPDPYRAIATELIIKNGEAYQKTAAGTSIHHAYLGGLIYHSYRMARAAELLATIYGYDRNLAVCGCLIHDIGKIKELSTDWTGHSDYTIEGQLESHSQIGVRMVEEAARETGFYDTEQVKMLIHIIASHHGTLDTGALHVPMTCEAMLVHELDMIDMQQEIYENNANRIERGQITLYDVGGLGHKLYKPLM